MSLPYIKLMAIIHQGCLEVRHNWEGHLIIVSPCKVYSHPLIKMDVCPTVIRPLLIESLDLRPCICKMEVTDHMFLIDPLLII